MAAAEAKTGGGGLTSRGAPDRTSASVTRMCTPADPAIWDARTRVPVSNCGEEFIQQAKMPQGMSDIPSWPLTHAQKPIYSKTLVGMRVSKLFLYAAFGVCGCTRVV